MANRPSLEQRKGYLVTIPWVTLLKNPRECTGWHSKSWGRRPCKNRAFWKFRASKRSRYTEDGVFCLNHLFSRGLYGDMDEEDRTTKWVTKHPPPWKEMYDTGRAAESDRTDR